MKKRSTKILSLLLALVMVFSLLPMQAFAVGESRNTGVARKDLKPLPLPDCPAQTLVSDEIDGLTVTVEAPKGALPWGVEMNVTKLENLDAVQAAVDAMEGVSGTALVAADITFVSEGKEIQPQKEVTVTMQAKELQDKEGLTVVHLDASAQELEDGEEVEAEPVEGVNTDELNTVTFEASKFSTFTVVWSSSSSDPTVTTLRFRYGGTTYVNVIAHYVNEDGQPITRPTSIGNNTDVSMSNRGNNVYSGFEAVSSLTLSISGHTYVGAYVDAAKTQPITDVGGILYYDSGWKYVATFYNDSDDPLEDYTSYGTGSDQTLGHIYLVYSGAAATFSNSVTIHFVDEQGTELTVKNTTLPTSLTPSAASPAYLIYDVEGYKYSATYYSTTARTTPGGTSIQPQLHKNSSNQWCYYNSNTAMANNSHIYVVYEKLADVIEGGTATIDPNNEVWPEEKPSFSKFSTSNGDGTNTIALTITGPEKAIENKTKANVIVVFDISGSMRDNMAGTQTYTAAQASQMNHSSRMWIAANAVAKNSTGGLAYDLLSKTDSQGNHLVEMALISFSSTATQVQGFTSTYNTFANSVWGLTPSGGTNWEGALQMANRMKNIHEVFTDAPTFIVFVTDGDPTFRVSRMDANDSDLAGEVNASSGNAQPYYISNHIYGEGDDDCKGYNLDAAVAESASIITHNKSFYAIGVSNDVTKVETLVTRAGGKAENAILATNADALNQAFKDIASAISASLGFGDVSLNDGITDLANVDMKVLHEVNPESFTYYRYGGEGNKYGADYEHKTEWTLEQMAAEKCGQASYDEDTGAVQWNMGPNFQMENNVTYVVTFRVWASQEALDLVAAVNNGWILDEDGNIVETVTPAEAYAALTEEERAQIVEVPDSNPKQYALVTNTNEVYATYKKTTKTGEVVSISDPEPVTIDPVYGDIPNLDLPSMTLSIKKVWEDDLTGGEDRVNSVTFILKHRVAHTGEYEEYPVPQSDGTISSHILLNDDNNWTFTLYVAPGVATGEADENGNPVGDPEILEKGYEFTLAETEMDYHYELNEEEVNPMEFNGQSQYWGDGNADQALSGVNAVKGGIDIRKIVTDADGNVIDCDEEFTIKGWILDPDGNPYTFDQSWDPREDKSVKLEAGVSEDWDNHQNDTGAYHKWDAEGNRVIYKGHFDSTGEITLTLKQGEYYRFINVPADCTYCFYEVDENGDPVEGVTMPAGFEFSTITGLNQQRDPAPKDDQGNNIYDDAGNQILGEFHPLPDDQQPTYNEETHQLTGTVYANTQHNVEVYNRSLIHDDFFYVYHSSDKTVEKIYADDTRVIKGAYDEASEKYEYTFTMAAEAKTGTLYGGYYSDYSGKSADFDAEAMTYDDKSWATDEGATPYTGANVTSSVWILSEALTENGLEMHPEMGKVYYLKEVPADKYLRPYLHYTYKTGTGGICSAWLISDVDDLNYQQTGFVIVDSNNEAEKVVSSLTVSAANGTTTIKLTPKRVFGANSSNYLTYLPVINRNALTGADSIGLLANGYSVMQYWVTPDKLIVTGTTSRVYTGLGNIADIGFSADDNAYSVALFETSGN